MPVWWLPILDFEGWYESSDLGRVRSLDRWIAARGGGLRFLSGRVLTQSWNGRYYVVGLHRGGVRHTRLVHLLVAQAHLGPPMDGQEVLHGAGGARDNQVSNLSYGTHSGNMLDMRRDGTHHHLNKDHCPLEHLYAESNLVAAALKRGERNCLACSRARSHIWRHFTRHGLTPPEGLQVVADRYYADIMRGATG